MSIQMLIEPGTKLETILGSQERLKRGSSPGPIFMATQFPGKLKNSLKY